jgi:hypothetical protein
MTNSEVKKDSPSEERILLPEVKDPLLALKEYLLKVTKALPTIPQEACLYHLPLASAKADDVLSPSVPFRFSSLSIRRCRSCPKAGYNQTMQNWAGIISREESVSSDKSYP